MRIHGCRLCALQLAAAILCAASGDPLTGVRQGFIKPPGDCRIMMRWWWFGPAVTKAEVERELKAMSAAGIGGVEIQPVYPLELDAPQKGFHNTPYLSGEFLEAVRFASERAKQLGLRVDITLGSGWPYGGPHTPVTEAAGRLRIERLALAEGAHSAIVPAMENGETFIAAFAVKGDVREFAAESAVRLAAKGDGRVELPAGLSGAQAALFFIASRTGQQVKRAGVGAEGFVLDHYSLAAVRNHLLKVGEPLIEAFGENPPYAVFSDSLEVFSADWTDDLAAEFERRRGYDLIPHLPTLAGGVGEEAMAVRHDWGRTLTELAEEHYLMPLAAWAHAHHTLFRSQSYGEPPVTLSSAALVDLAEGEAGPRWRTFNTARWAASANHLYGRNVTSTETWTWLHAPSFRATPLDMKAEADLHFVEGVNQLVGHGWPYSPPEAGEPGWRFYAAAAFNDHNPWFQVMPDLTRYMQRISYLMRQGQPVNDVAIYVPTDDAWANFKPGKTSVDRQMETLLGLHLIPQILDAGFNFDYLDDRAMAKVGVPYRVLILPGVERIPLDTLKRIEEYVSKGGHVIAVRRMPSQAPGLLNEQAETAQIGGRVRQLFAAKNKGARFAADEQKLGTTLREIAAPDLETGMEAAPVIGFAHRKLENGEIYFVANTSNRRVETRAKFRVSGKQAELWDPFTGEQVAANCSKGGDGTGVDLKLAPYESRVVVFAAGAAGVREKEGQTGLAADLSGHWKVKFEGLKAAVEMPALKSWTEEETTKFYSGQAVYEKTFEMADLRNEKFWLDFGEGQRVESAERAGSGMRALLESPVRESAEVYVNGQWAGSLWHPPYELEVTKWLKAGGNSLRVEVANLAINEMAGQAPQTYRLLNQRFGERFTPQGFENLQALPAGLLGPVRLMAARTDGHVPTLYIIGDSTVRNGSGDGRNGQWGWGDLIGAYFDSSKLNVVNRARGGRSSRTFVTEGLWDEVASALRPGDFVMMQFGHNDGGAVNDESRARGSLKGTGEETQEIDNLLTKKHEVVHTFGWYMRRFIADTKAKGATPIVCSMIPRKIWKDGKIERNKADYAGWAAEAAKAGGAAFIDLNEAIARKYDDMGQETVNPLFTDEHTHTTLAGAQLNAEIVIEGLRSLRTDPLAAFFSGAAAAQ